MAEMWLDNPRRVRTRGPQRRPRVTIAGDTVTFGKRSPLKGRVHRANAPGGALMLANKKHRRRRGMPAALKRYWATHRRKSRARRNDPSPRRRRMSVRHVVRYRRNPGRARAFFSVSKWQTVGMTALGMTAPSFVTDTLLPMAGIILTGWFRRGAQLAVPVGIQYFAPRILGRDTSAFVAGGYAVCLLGAVNDLTGGMPGMVGRYERKPLAGRVGGYERIPLKARASLLV